MIGPPTGAHIWLAAGSTDLRRGFTGLSALVQTALEQDPFSGHVFVLRDRRGDLLKLLWWDGDGLCLFAKRLERGRFIWPKADGGTVALSRVLAPLVEVLCHYVLATPKPHADDTPVPVLAPGTGRLWTYVRDDRAAGDESAPAVWFAYSPNRKGEHPQRHLKDFRGTLQADAFAGFNTLYEDAARGIVEAACWAHVRREFYDLQQAHASPLAAEALQRIGALYAIESEIRGRPPDERRAIRQARARPLLDSLHEWLQTTLVELSKKSAVATAISYALGRWPALVRYCGDGLLEIDNNSAERVLRAVALGRKNYLFASTD